MLPKFEVLFDQNKQRENSRPPPTPQKKSGEKGGLQTKKTLLSISPFSRLPSVHPFATGKHVVQRVQDTIQKEAEDKVRILQKLYKLSDAAETVLFNIKSVFPFHLFPNKIIIDIHKITVSYTGFFCSDSIQSIFYKDIGGVTVETGPFFATLKILNRLSMQNPIIVDYLRKREAVQAHKIIQGLLVIDRKGIDVSSLEDYEIAAQVEQLGKVKHHAG